MAKLLLHIYGLIPADFIDVELEFEGPVNLRRLEEEIIKRYGNKIEEQYISSDNALSLLRGHQVVVDALDNPASKIILQEKAAELQIPLVHGAISGWLGQVATILPGDTALKAIYPPGIEVNETAGNPSFTPALVAAIQVSQVIKLLIGRGELIRPQLLYIDLLGQHIAGIKLP
jgi:molybdopterin/thiamine biosynthesis adenylyltransferase